MRHLLLLCTLATGCDLLFGDESASPDARLVTPVDAAVVIGPDAGVPVNCLTTAQRSHDCSYDLTGTAVDFTTLLTPDLPGVQLQLGVTTAWDQIPPFPANCPTLASLPISGSGYFELFDAPCDSPQFPPITLLLVDDAPSGADLYAATASDNHLDCPVGPQCNALSMIIPVPRKVVVDDWRAQLLADGMPGADTRGLILYQYLAGDGTPAPGVHPTVVDGVTRRFLTPRTEVRFLAADRLTLIQADASITGVSGWAIIAFDEEVAYVGGEDTGGALWESQGTLIAPGWLFVESDTVDVP